MHFHLHADGSESRGEMRRNAYVADDIESREIGRARQCFPERTLFVPDRMQGCSCETSVGGKVVFILLCTLFNSRVAHDRSVTTFMCQMLISCVGDLE